MNPQSNGATEEVKRLERRGEVPSLWMMYGMRSAWSPDDFVRACARVRLEQKEPRRQARLLVRGWDNLICGRFVSRSDVYFSVGDEVRDRIENALNKLGRSRSPGHNAGLHAAVRGVCSVSDIDVEVALRFGPTESLYGDLYENLRRYELLAWGFLRGLATVAFSEASDDWRADGWWRSGVKPADRTGLVAAWANRIDYRYPWQAAGMGHLLGMIEIQGRDRQPKLTRGDVDLMEFARDVKRVSSIRNYVSHPLGEVNPEPEDFIFVADSLSRLLAWVHGGVGVGAVDLSHVPGNDKLFLTEILRSQLYGDAETLNEDLKWSPLSAKEDASGAAALFDRWKG